MSHRTDGQNAIDALTAKLGQVDSVDPANLALDQLQVLLDGALMRDEPVTPVELTNANLLNLNHPDWGNQPEGAYFLVGIGSAWSNLPSDGAHVYTFQPASSYTAFIRISINTPSAWSQSFAFTTTSDFTNNDLARQSRRAASSFAGAAAVGWRVEALTRD